MQLLIDGHNTQPTARGRRDSLSRSMVTLPLLAVYSETQTVYAVDAPNGPV